ncbi:DMT family transporter [Staphylococcus durrellii]|uniref:DMT family transporter n=1 Tax=Staphylococcus durrellii TaxID=2781773 RepID=UPI001ABA9B26|nr:multidrug efflux SMR transporter [Staphylococcus durrellii]
MDWMILIVAGVFEMLGVTALNAYTHNRKLTALINMIVSFALSFVCLAIAMANLPMSTSYAVWTGIGTVGGAIIGMLFYNESKNLIRILCIVVILASTIGLKLLS